MIEFIPISFYSAFYHYVLLGIILITVLHTHTLLINDSTNLRFIKVSGVFLFVFVLFYIGLRPISGVFIDMMTYNNRFERFQRYGFLEMNKSIDYFFDLFTLFCTKIMTVQMYFFICAVLYVVPLWFASKKWFNEKHYYGFLLLVGSFSFWNFGTNGIRNGIATSIFLLGLSRDKRVWQIIWFVVAVNFHKTMLLPALGFICASYYNKPKYFIGLWMMSIPLSLAFGSVFQGVFSGFLEDDRVSYLTDEASVESFASVGFRWDFLLYSALAVFTGWYYIFKKKFDDPEYNVLFCTYLFANAFWILVIKANFSNRFAYLSWFMMAIIMIYPLLKSDLLKNQHLKIGYLLLFYYAFTFLMNVILIK